MFHYLGGKIHYIGEYDETIPQSKWTKWGCGGRDEMARRVRREGKFTLAVGGFLPSGGGNTPTPLGGKLRLAIGGILPSTFKDLAQYFQI
jgi:hypothetical protein